MINVLDYTKSFVSKEYREEFLEMMAEYDGSTTEEVKGAFYDQNILAMKYGELYDKHRWAVRG